MKNNRRNKNGPSEENSSTGMPTEYLNGKVHLSKPTASVHEKFCWKPDFQGENMRIVMWYRDLLPRNHKGRTAVLGSLYEAKTMSPEAAALFKNHKTFWEQLYRNAKKVEKENKANRNSDELRSQTTTAEKAGTTVEEETSRLNALKPLASLDGLKMLVHTLKQTREESLFEFIMAGTSLNKRGKLDLGETLKQFGDYANFLALICLAVAPTGAKLDESLVDRKRKIVLGSKMIPSEPRVESAEDEGGEWNRDLLMVECLHIIREEIVDRLPNLVIEACWEPCMLESIDEKRAASLTLLKRVWLFVKELSIPASSAFTSYSGGLRLCSLEALEDSAAENLSKMPGHLSFSGDRLKLSDTASRVLASHQGKLTLYGDYADFSPAVRRVVREHRNIDCRTFSQDLDV